MKRAFRFRFYPTAGQAVLLARTFGCVRVVWNDVLAFRSKAWGERSERVSYADASARLTWLKRQPEYAWLNDVSCVPLQQTLRHQQTAFTNFFEKRAQYPRFKKRGRGDAAEFTRSAFRYNLATRELRLAKMSNPLDVRWSRSLPEGAMPSTVTVTRDRAGRWHVSLLVEDPRLPDPLPEAPNEIVGVDVGLTSLAVLSTGEKMANPKHLDRDLARLRRAQKILSRKRKGSSNYRKAARRVARVHARIADRRRDQLHKLTTRLVRENQTVVIEDLSIANMVRNRSLARSISDAGWGELRRQLEYKTEWYGRVLVVVDKWFPSTKRCSHCGHKNDVLTLQDRVWICPECGTVHDRDENAATNLRAAGLAVRACGDDVRPVQPQGVGKANVEEPGNQDEQLPGIPRL